MTTTSDNLIIEDSTANPAVIGLAGFGMTTILLNLHNVGLFNLNTMVLAMGIFFGGIAQAIAGKMEWQKNNMFGMLAFTAYGFFWMILVALLILPTLGVGEVPPANAMGWFLLLWGVFTFGLFIASFNLSIIMRFLFGTLVILFVLLAIADFSSNATVKFVAGVDGILCGGIALYMSLAMVINNTHGKKIMPLV